jgi:hypothetical protein
MVPAKTIVGECGSKILAPYSTDHSGKVSDSHIVNRLPDFYGARRYIAVFLTSPPLVLILHQINKVHTSKSYYSKIHFNTILQPMSWSSH